jgi:hypothetical protein
MGTYGIRPTLSDYSVFAIHTGIFNHFDWNNYIYIQKKSVFALETDDFRVGTCIRISRTCRTRRTISSRKKNEYF